MVKYNIIHISGHDSSQVKTMSRNMYEYTLFHSFPSSLSPRCLVTNMIVNFLTAPSRPSRHQALQILASVIDMTPQDRQKIGLEPSQAFNPNQSLSEAFIQFLESESSPRSKAQVRGHPSK
jgi:hypothetical protein